MSTVSKVKMAADRQTDMEDIYQGNGSWKQAGAPILMSDKVYWRPKSVWRDKEINYMAINGEIH